MEGKYIRNTIINITMVLYCYGLLSVIIVTLNLMIGNNITKNYNLNNTQAYLISQQTPNKMYQADNQNDLNRHLLNNSERDKYNFRLEDDLGAGKDRLFCQICSQLRPATQMFTFSEHCDPQHKFCLPCLVKKVEECISANEDIYCQVDYCPYLMSETSKFFTMLPNHVHNRYVMWKASSQYLKRGQSFRQSKKAEGQGAGYFGYFGSDGKDKGEKNEQDQIKGNPYGAVDVYEEVDKQKSVPKEKKKKNKGNRKEPKPKKEQQPKPKVAPVEVPEPRQQIMARAVPQPVPPIPFHAPAPAPAPAANQLIYLPPTAPQRICKLLLIIFGLPLMLVLMCLLIVEMVFIYALMIVSFAGSLGCIVLGVYYAIEAVTTNDASIQKEYTVNGIVLGVLQLLFLGFAWFFAKNIRYINYLVIKNGWIWFIQRLVQIWAYPYKAPVVHIGPRVIPLAGLNQE